MPEMPVVTPTPVVPADRLTLLATDVRGSVSHSSANAIGALLQSCYCMAEE